MRSPCKAVSSFVLLLAIAFLSTCVNSTDPYRFFNWRITYGDINPRGIKHQGILINVQLPGPHMDAVTNGNLITIRVLNQFTEPFLISWNGLQQRGNSAQDGVFGTTCTIPPSKNFTYVLQVNDQIGNFFYFPGLQELQSAPVALNLDNQVTVSTPHSHSVVLDPFPPCREDFYSHNLSSVEVSLLQFNFPTGSPLVLSLYPYYLFNTKVRDAMIDAAYFSMKNNRNITNFEVLVTETKGDSNESYMGFDHSGTSLLPETASRVFVYELFDERLRSRPVSEADWGLFYGNATPVYLLRVTGTKDDIVTRRYCVAQDGVDSWTLQTALDWVCGPGGADCSGIQPGENCFEPNDVKSHASYAFDSYFQAHGQSPKSCDFRGAAKITTINPSHDSCTFPGRSVDPSSNAGEKMRGINNILHIYLVAALLSLFFLCSH